jgi:hypothetical protein
LGRKKEDLRDVIPETCREFPKFKATCEYLAESRRND